MGTLLDLASLVMIPSGVKEDKLYSVKPTDGSGDFTFSRNSDIQATRVNSSGLIEKAKENLVLQSNTFDTTWTTSNASLTGGQSGYDGTNDAWLLQNNAGFTTTAVVKQDFSLGSAVRSSSVYAKAGNVNFLRILMYDGATSYVSWFNLTDGSISDESNIIDAKSTSVGGGWYRCEISANTNITNLNIYPSAVAGSSLTDNGDNIYIQDAQLNYGLIAQDYVETTTTSVVEGITADLPRLDYSGGASCPSLLLEGSRTNSVLQSEYFGTYWSPNQMSVSSNVDTSPEGVVNAGLLIPSTSSTSTHRVRGVVSVTAGQNHTFSCFFKKENYAYAQLRSGTGWQINVDLNDGSFTTSGTSLVDGDVEDYGNGWYRAYVVGSEAGTSQGFDISVFDSDSFGGFAGDGTSGVLAYGAMVEQGSYPTSYIPTYGASAQRNADDCSKTGISSLIGQTEGTVFVEVDYSTLSGLNMFMSIRPDSSNKVEVYRDGATIYGEITAGSTFNMTAVKAVGIHKIAFAYKSGSSALYIDGVLAGQSTTAFSFTSSLVDIAINSRSGGTFKEAANYNQAILFKTRLSNAELAALTTI